MNTKSTSGTSISRLSRRRLLAATLVASTAVAVSNPARLAARPTAVSHAGDCSGQVDIGGRRMFLQCRGQGDPTVVFLSGYLNTGGAWLILPDEVAPPSVYSGVAEFTRVFTYDRPGTLLDADPPDDRSRSDTILQPSTVETAVADLHALLTTAGIPGPYVLAGHSFGGLLSRLYAATYPDEVVGMVLVDSFSEEIRAALMPEHWQTWLATNGVLPEDVLAANPETERFDINAAADTMMDAAAAHPLRQMPLVVLTAGQTGVLTPEQIAEFPAGYYEALTTALKANSTFLATLLPDVRYIYAANSGHYIQAEEPALVIGAIQQVVEAVRDPSTWTA
jgi:pimeloyl-ACP methyl ester carboxylesterase